MIHPRAIFFLVFSLLLLGRPAILHATGDAGDATTSLESGDKAFEAGQYTEAIKVYEALYERGEYSEQMLYRLAYLHENLRAYPQAIFYLKKAAQEYGERGTDGKIRQLMQRQGSTRFFSGDGWNDYMLFFRKWNWAFLLAFFGAITGIAAHYLLPRKQLSGWRQLAVIGAWVVFFLSGAAMFHKTFLVPDRAVLMQDTAFYAEPGFSSDYRLGSFSLGETLEITSRSDIWVQISAAGRQWWVPNWVVREL